MYAGLWRILPGPVWVRLLLVLLLLTMVLFALSTWVFPYIDQFVTNQEATVGSQ